MKRFVNIIILASIFTNCNYKSEIIGNWCFCDDQGKYTEVYVNDTIFRFYFSDIGFNPMTYKIKHNDSIFLFDMSKQLKLSGKISKLKYNYGLINLVIIETNEKLILELSRFSDDCYIPNSSNVDDYYEWLNKKFIPRFNKRRLKFKCH